jgi:hypothetical protein
MVGRPDTFRMLQIADHRRRRHGAAVAIRGRMQDTVAQPSAPRGASRPWLPRRRAGRDADRGFGETTAVYHLDHREQHREVVQFVADFVWAGVTTSPSDTAFGGPQGAQPVEQPNPPKRDGLA